MDPFATENLLLVFLSLETLCFIHIFMKSTGYPIYKMFFSAIQIVIEIELLRLRMYELGFVEGDKMLSAEILLMV